MMTGTFWVLFAMFVFAEVSARQIVKRQASQFTDGHIVGIVGSSRVTEASGLGASRRHPGVLYTHNDSGGEAKVYAIDGSSGKRLATLQVTGAINWDWEDLAVGPCSDDISRSCIYIADTGEKGGDGATNIIYRVEEPEIIDDGSIPVKAKLLFRWDQTDAETIMVDPTGEVYIVSKVPKGKGILAQLPKSSWGTGSRVYATPLANLTISSNKRDPVGGDISPDGTEVLLKGKENKIFYWKLSPGDTYADVLGQDPIEISCRIEVQGESVCWSVSGSGYYTLSEGEDQPLYFYVRRW